MNQLCLASKDPEQEEWPQHYPAAPESIQKSMCREMLLKGSCSAVAIHHSLSLGVVGVGGGVDLIPKEQKAFAV